MAETTITLSATGGVPRVGISFGFANVAGYHFWPFDRNNENPIKVGSGNNTDAEPDVHFVGASAAALDGCALAVEAAIGSPVVKPEGPSNQYSVGLTITQDGEVVADNPDVFQGPLNDGAKHFLEYLRFASS